jgi:hypothetical protein
MKSILNWLRVRREHTRKTTLSKVVDAATGETVGSRVVISNHPHIRDFAFLVTFKVTCNSPWPSEADFDKFDLIQDRMDALLYEWEFCCVGMFTFGGARTWFLYAKDARTLVDRLTTKFADFSPNLSYRRDPEWIEYKRLRDAR